MAVVPVAQSVPVPYEKLNEFAAVVTHLYEQTAIKFEAVSAMISFVAAVDSLMTAVVILDGSSHGPPPATHAAPRAVN